MTRNLPTLKDIAEGGALSGLSLDALDALLGECDAEAKMVGAAKKAITAHIEATYQGDIARAYDAKGSDFGTVRISDGGYEVVVDRQKKVEWSQAELGLIFRTIQTAGDNPAEYIKVAYSVEERAYTAWPAHIRNTFEPARLTKPGATSVKLVQKEAA